MKCLEIFNYIRFWFEWFECFEEHSKNPWNCIRGQKRVLICAWGYDICTPAIIHRNCRIVWFVPERFESNWMEFARHHSKWPNAVLKSNQGAPRDPEVTSNNGNRYTTAHEWFSTTAGADDCDDNNNSNGINDGDDDDVGYKVCQFARP